MTSSSLRRDMIVGSLWMVMMRWSIRGIGVISTIVLARILVPQDFGLIAMASIMIGLLETLSSFGVDTALIQNVQATRKHFDTAWTVQVIQGASIALILVLCAPLAADYFGEPRVSGLIRFLSLGVAIGGLGNIGVVAFRKDLNFGLEYRFSVYKKVIAFVVTIGLAITLHSYWALAVGIVVSQGVGVVLSYLMHPYRPRLSLEVLREVWAFSQWMLIISIGNYSYDKADEFVVGKLSASREMGLYTIAYEISNLPTTELLYPISRALYPGYAKLVEEPNRLTRAYLNVLGFISTFSVAAGFGIALVADDLTSIVLGPRWADAVPLIRWLAIFGVLRAVYGQAGNVLIALGHAKVLAINIWLQVLLLIVLTIAGGLEFGVVGIAVAKLCVGLVVAQLYFQALVRNTSITLLDIAGQIWRPCVAGVAMVAAVLLLPQSAFGTPFVSLIRSATCGALVYISALVVLWLGAGRPSGTEELVVESIAKQYRRLRPLGSE